ncbi:MAG: hypothetical protein E7010_04060 [Alphaproteobacteria bacterium]|nr:hypothetical protein [Alphaproteobacteria bacterium]
MFADFEQNSNNEDYLDDFRQKLNAPSAEAFEERKNEINRSKNVFIGTVSGIALAAVVGWFVLSPRYAEQANVEIPVIRRPQTAVKVQPSDPGGMEIQNQDKSVYDIIEKKQDTALVVENLLPPPEIPQLPAITAETTAALPEIEKSEVIEKAEAIIQKAEENKVVPESETKDIKVVTAAPVVAPKEETTPATTSKEIVAEKETAPVKEATKEIAVASNNPVVEKVNVPNQSPAPAKIKTATTGDWQVQLISSPNRASVDSAWTDLVKKYPSLKGQPREIETADLGTKGTYYRLKAGAFADRSGADRLCSDIKALGGTCIVKKK